MSNLSNVAIVAIVVFWFLAAIFGGDGGRDEDEDDLRCRWDD